jgi:hypothetical protein
MTIFHCFLFNMTTQLRLPWDPLNSVALSAMTHPCFVRFVGILWRSPCSHRRCFLECEFTDRRPPFHGKYCNVVQDLKLCGASWFTTCRSYNGFLKVHADRRIQYFNNFWAQGLSVFLARSNRFPLFLYPKATHLRFAQDERYVHSCISFNLLAQVKIRANQCIVQNLKRRSRPDLSYRMKTISKCANRKNFTSKRDENLPIGRKFSVIFMSIEDGNQQNRSKKWDMNEELKKRKRKRQKKEQRGKRKEERRSEENRMWCDLESRRSSLG